MEDKDKQAFERNTKKLDYILGHQEVNRILSPKRKEIVRKAVDLMRETINLEEEKEAKGKDKSRVKEALNIVLSTAINQPITPILKDLAYELGLLSFNWNKTYGRREDIKQACLDIKALTEGLLSLNQIVSISKYLLQEVKNIKQYSPPVFDLSKAYLKSLLDKEEVKGV